MLFERIALKVVALCVLCCTIAEQVETSPSSGHPAPPPHFESLRRKQRTVDATLPRLGDLQAGAAGVLNQHFVPLVDCAAIYKSGLNISGLYYINPDGNGDFLVYCDMSRLDGVYNGWTVIQRRVSDSVDFNKYWNDYTFGFGDLNANFWLGLNKIKRITDSATYKLYIAVQFQDADVVSYESVRFAEYDSFSLGTSANNYQLSVSSYNSTISTAGDSLISRHNGKYFSTRDRDNDNSPPDCAGQYQSGWWFNGCLDSNLNGVWESTGYLDTVVLPVYFGVSWKTAEQYQSTYSFKTAVMAVRTNR